MHFLFSPSSLWREEPGCPSHSTWYVNQQALVPWVQHSSRFLGEPLQLSTVPSPRAPIAIAQNLSCESSVTSLPAGLVLQAHPLSRYVETGWTCLGVPGSWWYKYPGCAHRHSPETQLHCRTEVIGKGKVGFHTYNWLITSILELLLQLFPVIYLFKLASDVLTPHHSTNGMYTARNLISLE